MPPQSLPGTWFQPCATRLALYLLSDCGSRNQVPGRDFGGIFAPVCRLRMVLAVAAQMDLEVRQREIKRLLLRAHNQSWDVWYMYPSM